MTCFRKKIKLNREEGRFLHSSMRMTKLQSPDMDRRWRGSGATGTLSRCWEEQETTVTLEGSSMRSHEMKHCYHVLQGLYFLVPTEDLYPHIVHTQMFVLGG